MCRKSNRWVARRCDETSVKDAFAASRGNPQHSSFKLTSDYVEKNREELPCSREFLLQAKLYKKLEGWPILFQCPFLNLHALANDCEKFVFTQNLHGTTDRFPCATDHTGKLLIIRYRR